MAIILATKKVGISFIYRDTDAGNPGIINILNGFNNMLSDLPADIRHNIDNIEFKIEPAPSLMDELKQISESQTLERSRYYLKRLVKGISEPFMALSFMALPVIPKLKLTDKGLVDVEKFALIDLFETII